VIDVRRLNVLKAVVETGSVAAAAELLNYTPSAVSQQMSTLERETGVRLLERVGRRVRPTEVALLLCEHTSRVLAAKRQLDIAMASEEPWIGVSSCPDLCALVVEVTCARAGFQPRYVLEADEYPTALGFIAAGLGVALVPMMALGSSPPPGVAVRRLKGIQPERQVWALTRAAVADELPVRAMIACLKNAAEEFVREVVGPLPARVAELVNLTG
jgi:DNA-binding transcriptional LysR family regulator